MAFDPNSLKPQDFTDDQICSWIESNNTATSSGSLNMMKGYQGNSAIYDCCAYLLASVKGFDSSIGKGPIKFVENQSDLNYSPESCGKDQYDEYRTALSNATGLISSFKRIHDMNEKCQFIGEFVENMKITSITQFMNTIVSQMDVALSWICYLLNKDQSMRLDSILFQEKNPLRPVFSGIKCCLRTPEPFNHIYTTNDAKEFQKCILKATEENIFINYPKIIVFAGENNEIIKGELPEFVALPMKLSKKALGNVLERCAAWKKAGLPEGEEVIKKYKQTFELKYYEIAGFINESEDKAYKIVSKNTGKVRQSSTKFSGERQPVCVIYQLITE